GDMRDFAGALGADSVPSDPASPVDRSLASSATRWEQFIRLHPDSIFTPFIQLTLAEIYGYGLEQAAPNPSRAYELLSAVIEHGPKFLHPPVLLKMAEVTVELGKYDEADKI